MLYWRYLGAGPLDLFNGDSGLPRGSQTDMAIETTGADRRRRLTSEQFEHHLTRQRRIVVEADGKEPIVRRHH